MGNPDRKSATKMTKVQIWNVLLWMDTNTSDEYAASNFKVVTIKLHFTNLTAKGTWLFHRKDKGTKQFSLRTVLQPKYLQEDFFIYN
jgi:hypothetical protein